MWTTIVLVAALGLTPGQADLSLTHVRSTHGLLGPERRDETLAPGDTLYVCFDIDGVTIDSDGKVLYSIALEVSDAGGKVLFKQEPKDQEAKTSLGGNSVPAYASLNVNLDQPAGDYQLKVTVKDRASGKERSLTRNFKVLPRDFALVRLTTSVDADAMYPAAAYASGQGVWAHGSAVGFARGPDKQPNVLFEMRVFDDSGKPTLTRPLTSTVNKDVPDKIKGLPVAFPLSLNRPGKFTVELTATDQISGKKTKASFPIIVLPAQK